MGSAGSSPKTQAWPVQAIALAAGGCLAWGCIMPVFTQVLPVCVSVSASPCYQDASHTGLGATPPQLDLN